MRRVPLWPWGGLRHVLIARFTTRHLQCVTSLLGGQPDVVTSVPSTRAQPRRGKHPLETAITRVGALASLHAPLLMRGSAPADHNRADDDVFAVPRQLVLVAALSVECGRAAISALPPRQRKV